MMGVVVELHSFNVYSLPSLCWASYIVWSIFLPLPEL